VGNAGNLVGAWGSSTGTPARDRRPQRRVFTESDDIEREAKV
jgi:hypothetical protein